MKKICYIATIPFTIRSFFMDQMIYLAKNGFEVNVICGFDEKLQEDLGEDAKYICCNMPRGINLLQSIKSVLFLLRIFRIEKFDLVQYCTSNAGLYASIAAFINRVPIRNYHLMGLRYQGEKGLKRLILKQIEKLTCLLSTHIECVSKSNLEVAIEEGIFARNKGAIIWNGSTGGVNLEKFNLSKKAALRKEMRDSLKITEDDIVFGYIGRINVDKGINELLWAFRKLTMESRTDIKLILAGNIEDKQLFNKEIFDWAEDSENVYFLPNKNDVERYYSLIDVLVFPSYREGFGNVIIEAEAMEVPVIASQIPGPIDAMVPGKTGLFVKAKDGEDLYLKMHAMLSKEVRQDNIQYSLHFVKENFDSDILCKHILERKKSLLNLNN